MSIKSLKNVMFAVDVAASAILSLFADGLPEGFTHLPYITASGNCQIKNVGVHGEQYFRAIH